MKISYSLFTLFSLFLICNCQKQKGEIHYISLSTNTITFIKCENLKNSPNKKNHILSEKENDTLICLFSNLKVLQKDLDVDARIYGSIIDGSQKIDFCSGIGVIEINNKKYSVDNNLRLYLLKLTKN